MFYTFTAIVFLFILVSSAMKQGDRPLPVVAAFGEACALTPIVCVPLYLFWLAVAALTWMKHPSDPYLFKFSTYLPLMILVGMFAFSHLVVGIYEAALARIRKKHWRKPLD